MIHVTMSFSTLSVSAINAWITKDFNIQIQDQPTHIPGPIFNATHLSERHHFTVDGNMQITFFAHSGIIRATSDLIKWATQERTLLIPPYANVLDGLVSVYFSTCWGSSCMVPQCCLFNHTRNLQANQKDSGQEGSDSATDDPANLHMRSPNIGGYYILWLHSFETQLVGI